MAEIIVQNGACISLGSIDGEEDLKPRPGLINISPPPSNARCDCCGSHVSELRPFGGAGDPLVGDFEGDLLVKKKRPAGPYDEEAERIYKKYFNNDQTELGRKMGEWLLVVQYGTKRAARIISAVHAAGCVGSSWECRDCIILDAEEYFEKLGSRTKSKCE